MASPAGGAYAPKQAGESASASRHELAAGANAASVKKPAATSLSKKKHRISKAKARTKLSTHAKAKTHTAKKVTRPHKKKNLKTAAKPASVVRVKQPALAQTTSTASSQRSMVASSRPSGQWPASPFNPDAYPADQKHREEPIRLAALGGLTAPGLESLPKPGKEKSAGGADTKSGQKLSYDLAQKAAEPASKPADVARKNTNETARKDRSESAKELTFEELVRQALASHPSITAKRSSLDAAKANLAGANWQRFPTPSIEAGAASSQGGFGTIRVQQPIWTGGRISAGIEGADAQRKAAEVGIDEARRDVIQRLIAAFAEAQRQQLRQDIARKGVREHEKLLSLIERRVDQQVSPLVDQTFAKARMLQASNELSVVSQALSNALNQLTQLSGQQLSRVTPMKTVIADVPTDKAAALEQAAQRSPVLARIGFEEEAAGADISSKKSGYMPQVSVRYERASNSAITNTGSTDRVMLVLEAQPGAGLSAGAGVDSAIAKREAIRRSRDTALLEIQEKVITDWNDLVASRQRLESALQGRSVANEVADSYARQFTTGKKTWIDVMNSVRESTQAELLVADAEGQVIAAALRLKLVTGALDTAN